MDGKDQAEERDTQDEHQLRRNPPRNTSTKRRAVIYSLDMSPNKIKFIQERTTARQSLIKLLNRKGFKVSFNFELLQVEIETESEESSDAMKFIREYIVEMELEVENQYLPELENIQTTFLEQEGIEIMFLRDKNRQSVKVIGLQTGIESFQQSFSKTMGMKSKNLTPPVESDSSVQRGASASVSIEDAHKDEFISSGNESAEELNTLVAVASIEDEDVKTTGESVDMLYTRVSTIADGRKTSNFYCKIGTRVDNLPANASDVGSSHFCDVKFTQIRTNRSAQRACVNVVSGKIQETETDVIFNSTNSKLTLGVGRGMSTVVLKSAGDSIQDELRRYYENGIKSGEVAKSSSGRLGNCKAIYHGALPMFPNDRSRKEFHNEKISCYRALFMSVINALIMASAEGWKSIAFPALGTGYLGYPPHEAVHLMYLAVNEFFDSAVSPIGKVLFVIYSSADPALKQLFLMERFSSILQTVMVDGIASVHQELRKDASTVCETRFEFGKTCLQISNSDIREVCNVTNAVLILWEQDQIEGKKDNTVVSCFDRSLQRDIYSKYVSQLKEKGTKFVVDTTSFKITTLIHLYCKEDKDMEGVIERAIERGIKQLHKEDVTTIAIPVPSDGSRTWQPHIAAGIILKAVQKLKSLHHIVRVIIQDSQRLEPFLACMVDKCRLQKMTEVSSVFDNTFLLSDCPVSLGDTEIRITSESVAKNKTAAEELKIRLGIKVMFMLTNS